MLYKTTARVVHTKEDLFKKETRDALSSVQVYVDMVNKSMNDLRHQIPYSFLIKVFPVPIDM